ncbi:DNA repair protein [Trypanosoma conorhini]|uniref:DNA repair protein n=1 Tax=Trypanosoma conorhini TaxID=83891 RepID=A0A422NYR8_9TRYP|nr:DNA repair protein [Trypanosoma conorhini]RNF10652.1 DNA repair protein [Trypanosoma conorhini]
MPPPPPRGTVMVSATCNAGNITRLMQRHRYAVEEMDSDAYEFVCGRTCVLYLDDLNHLCDMSYRGAVSRRISSAKAQVASSGRRVLLLLLVGATDPRPDVLVWLNLHCSVEQRCAVMLCWNEEECASYLEGLTDGSVASVDYRTNSKKESAPIPVLIEAFTQTPQLMTRNDVVRAAHRYGSVAELLTASAEDLASLPGFGPKRAGRLHTVLHAGFHASRRLVSEVLPESHEPHPVQESETAPERSSAREKMLKALNELQCRELEDDSQND